MKNRIKHLFYGLCALAIILATGCSEKNTYRISGTWEAGDGQTVYLKKATGGKTFRTVDSVIVQNERFELQGEIPEIDLYKLFAAKDQLDVLLDKEPITVTVAKMTEANGKKTEAWEVGIKGSREQEILQKARGLAMGKSMVGLAGMFAMVQVKDDSVKLDSVYREIEEMKQQIDESIKAYMDSCNNSLAITYIIGDFIAREYPFEDVERYYNNLTPEVKASHPGQLLKEKIGQLKQINIGGIAPDIDLPGPDGKNISLSSLRGKYVLLDFWASWCGPCLAEVPNVKEIYERYKDRGFEVYGVSLDDKKDAWEKAIGQHGLTWTHVSSLKGWECPVAKQYNVTGIPRMYLLDKEGRIVAMDLRGDVLKEKVASFFN